MNLALLKEERIKKGLTQEKLAKLLGFKDKSSYCLIENGKTTVSIDTAKQIANHLDLTKEMLFKIFFTDVVQESSTYKDSINLDKEVLNGTSTNESCQ